MGSGLLPELGCGDSVTHGRGIRAALSSDSQLSQPLEDGCAAGDRGLGETPTVPSTLADLDPIAYHSKRGLPGL